MNLIEKYLKENFREDVLTIKEIFQHYDTDRDDFLDEDEFLIVLKDVFTATSDHEQITPPLVQTIVKVFDQDQDGKVSLKEFIDVWRYWLKQVLKPVTALVIIDVQNDFISGSLALKNCPSAQDGEEVISPINHMIDDVPFDVIVYSLDWHPTDHISFFDNKSLRPFHPVSPGVPVEDVKMMDTVEFDGPPKTQQVLWPRHCVQNSDGANLHPQLKIAEDSYIVYKGTNPDIDSYSAFWDNNKLSQTDLVKVLLKHHVTDVYVCGLAYDICVGFTASHSTEHGFRTTVVENGCRGVTVEGIREMKNNLLKKGVIIEDSDQVKDMVLGKNRNLQLGIKSVANYHIAKQIVQKNFNNN